MGELVNLQEYRLKKEEEEEARRQEECDRLCEEISEIMARLSLSPNPYSYPIFPDDDDYLTLQHDQLYVPALWPNPDHRDYIRDVRYDDEEYTYSLNDYENPKWYLDLSVKVTKDSDSYED